MGIKNCDENILEDENLLDCHRKELIGDESAKEILLAINLNLNNLLNELRIKNYIIGSPSMGISFDLKFRIKFNNVIIDILKYKNQLMKEYNIASIKIIIHNILITL